MKAIANIENLDSEDCKRVIRRNLSRILTLRIIDIDRRNGMLHFLYKDGKSLEQVRREMDRIGYPIKNLRHSGPERESSRQEDRLETVGWGQGRPSFDGHPAVAMTKGKNYVP